MRIRINLYDNKYVKKKEYYVTMVNYLMVFFNVFNCSNSNVNVIKIQ